MFKLLFSFVIFYGRGICRFSFCQILQLVRLLQELHVHNHIQLVWIAVYLAKFWFFFFSVCVCVYVCNQFVSLLCQNAIIYLSFHQQSTKLFLCAYKQLVMSLSALCICLLYATHTIQVKLMLSTEVNMSNGKNTLDLWSIHWELACRHCDNTKYFSRFSSIDFADKLWVFRV